MSSSIIRLSQLFVRALAAFSAALILGVPAAELAAAPVGYVYYLQTFGDWTVTCGRDESAGRDNCTLSAPPPDRHGESQIEIGNGQGDNDTVIVRVRGTLMPESPLYLRVDARAPHQTQPNRFGEGRWNGEEARAIVAELNDGQRTVVRSFSGPPPMPRDAFFSLNRFDEALADFERRARGAPPGEVAQAKPPEQTMAEEPPPGVTQPAVVAAPPAAPTPTPSPPAAEAPAAAQPPAQTLPQPKPDERPPVPAAGEQEAPQAQTEPQPQQAQRPASAGGAAEIIDEAHIGRARLTSNVVNREPVDDLGTRVDIPSSGEDFVYFFTEVRGMAGRTVTHRWQYGGNVVASVPFPIGSDRWRVYSRKAIGANQAGPWTVTAVDPNGKELARAAFTAE